MAWPGALRVDGVVCVGLAVLRRFLFSSDLDVAEADLSSELDQDADAAASRPAEPMG
jgi:hypothetical protein